MKKVLFAAVAVFAFSFANAQEGGAGFSKGDVFVSGAVMFGSTNEKNADVKTSGFEIEPKIGYFVSENIAIGGKIGFSSVKEKTAGTTTNDMSGLTVGGFGRYYFTPANQFSLFANLGIDYSSMTNKNVSPNVKTNGLDFGLGLGLNYFVSSNFSIEAMAGLLNVGSSKSDVTGDKGSSDFSFGGDWRAVSFGVNYKF